ncbi:hypothetical protein R3I93_011334 [Phoxinus phoxinus]|uniref:Ig-like domain-containing protein n=1 Tax=Phoxinus phoxinus TaxID=58324 RepID=A0AAN9CXR2_9TELE
MVMLIIIKLIILLHISEASDVTQTPILWAPQGESSQMNCSHTKGATYFYMYWYRQRHGETMRLIAFTMANNNPDFGEFSPDKYSADKTVAERGSFTVSKLEPDDSGVYFCAVSEHSDTDLLCCCTKTYYKMTNIISSLTS